MNFVPTATSLFMKLSIVAQVAGNDGTKSIHHSDSRLVWIHDCTPPTRSSVQSRLCTEAGPKNPAAVSSVSHMARALTRTLRHIHHVCYFYLHLTLLVFNRLSSFVLAIQFVCFLLPILSASLSYTI